MLKDVADKKKQDQETVLAAIQAVKAKGWDVNPYTVADEAKMPRAEIYRATELMELIARERGVADTAKHTAQELTKRVSELEDTNRALEERIHVLEKQSQNLEVQIQEAWQQGYQDCMQETVKQMTGEEAVQTGESELVKAVAAAPAAAAPQQETPVEVEEPAAAASGQIYNFARSTTLAGSYNPLVDLSWKDLETVYHFRVASLKEYGQLIENQPKEQAPPKPASNGEGAVEAPYAQAQAGAEAIQEPYAQPESGHGYAAGPGGETGDVPIIPTLERLEPGSAVDLDQMDIFDDLDEIAYLEELQAEIQGGTQPAQEPVQQAPEPEVSADEAREILANRIKQAAAVQGDLPTPVTTTPPPAATQGASAAAMAMAAQAQAAQAAQAQAQAAAQAAEAQAQAQAAAVPRSKFIGGKAAQQPPPVSQPAAPVRAVPPEIRKACLILGVRPEELTEAIVIEAWKRQIAAPGVHPDLGGDHEAAVFLNTAKATLVKWLETQGPKLGKKFGGPGGPGPAKPGPKK